jgi:predicted O-methyltransferase YrrM
MILDALRRVGRRLKRSPRFGPWVSQSQQLVSDCSLRLNSTRQRELQREWSVCTNPSQVLEFSANYLNPGQRSREIIAFAEYARAREPEVFCEIGMLSGGTHLFLTHALPSIKTTIALDPLVQNRAFLELLAKAGQRSFFVRGSSQSPETLARVSAILATRPIDLLFIDGDHRYEAVRSDFLNYRRLVREGGLIAFHDICEDFQTRFGRETGYSSGGVPQLWRKLRTSYEHREFVESPDQDAFGIGVIVHSSGVPIPGNL